jgi:hypothetical protein
MAGKRRQKKLGCKRSALGSLSEAATVFDPERLKEIIDELGDEIEPLGRDPRLQDVQGLLTTRGRHASCGIAQDDGGVSPRAEDRQWDGEVAASHPLRGGSLDPDAH